MLNEDLSSLQSSFLGHKLRLWKLFKQLLENFLRDTEEECSILFGCAQRIVFLTSNFYNKIGPQVKHELILAKEREARQLQEGCDTLLIVEDGRTSGNEIHFIEFLAIRNDCFAWLIDTAVHIHNQLMLEPNICIQKEITKLVFESLEKGLRYLVLDLGR